AGEAMAGVDARSGVSEAVAGVAAGLGVGEAVVGVAGPDRVKRGRGRGGWTEQGERAVAGVDARGAG
ncbi:hypothetical protein CYMTET_23070, partial [Cymbomonas tetramitiformis]